MNGINPISTTCSSNTSCEVTRKHNTSTDSKVSNCMKLLPFLALHESSNSKIILNHRCKLFIDKLEKNDRATFTILLRNVAPLDACFENLPILSLILHFLKLQFSQARATSGAASIDKEIKSLFDMGYYSLCVLDRFKSMLLRGDVRDLVAAIKDLKDLKTKICSTIKRPVSPKIMEVKTGSLTNCIKILELILKIANFEEGRQILSLPFHELASLEALDKNQLVSDLPYIINNLLVQLRDENSIEIVTSKLINETDILKENLIEEIIETFKGLSSSNPKRLNFFKFLVDKSFEFVAVRKETEVTFVDLTYQHLLSAVFLWDPINKQTLKISCDRVLNKLAKLDHISKELKGFKELGLFTQEKHSFIEAITREIPENSEDLRKKLKIIAHGKGTAFQLFELLNYLKIYKEKYENAWQNYSDGYKQVAQFIDGYLNVFLKGEQDISAEDYDKNFVQLQFWLSTHLLSAKTLLTDCLSEIADNNEASKKTKKRNRRQRKKVEKKSPIENGKTLDDNSSQLNISKLPPKDKDKQRDLPDLDEGAVKVSQLDEKLEVKTKQVKTVSSKSKGKEKESAPPVKAKSEQSTVSSKSKGKGKKLALPLLEPSTIPKLRNEEKNLLSLVSSAKNRKYRNFKKIVDQFGWKLDHVRGDHHIYKHDVIPGSISVPYHDIIKEGTARAIIKQIISLPNPSNSSS